jgi:hypothetical protein
MADRQGSRSVIKQLLYSKAQITNFGRNEIFSEPLINSGELFEIFLFLINRVLGGTGISC